MNILAIILTILVVSFVLFASAVGIVFFTEWAYIVVSDLLEEMGRNHKAHSIHHTL